MATTTEAGQLSDIPNATGSNTGSNNGADNGNGDETQQEREERREREVDAKYAGSEAYQAIKHLESVDKVILESSPLLFAFASHHIASQFQSFYFPPSLLPLTPTLTLTGHIPPPLPSIILHPPPHSPPNGLFLLWSRTRFCRESYKGSSEGGGEEWAVRVGG